MDLRMSITDIAPRNGTLDDGAIIDGASETLAAM
jgi:hypothetical protein